MSKVRNALDVLQHYGWRWTLYRLKGALSHRLGTEACRMPMGEWAPLRGNPTSPPPLPPATGGMVAAEAFSHRHPEAVAALLNEADEVLAGVFRKFEQPGIPLGFPPPWNEEVPGHILPGRGTHWSQVRPREDIKLAWELSRMGWAQVLGRAYAFSGNERYAEAFWELLENWCATNPPNHGPQWMCGQESALRALSLVLADGWFRKSPATTPERRALLLQVIRATGRRIAPHLHYARSQRNNHALNEALGLMTAAALVPDDPAAPDWAVTGRRAFEEDLLDQLDEEGSYIQHSAMYHRVMLHACAWRLLLAQAAGETLPPALLNRMRAGLAWMTAMADPRTGSAPNLGNNDGANILRLAARPYGDQRPALQALAALLGQPLPYPPGPWDEPVLWLLGIDPAALPRAEEARRELTAPGRGHFLRLGRESSLYFRCCDYRERPAQSDPLHVDITWREINVVQDAGTYRYNAPSPWSNSLAHTGVHNTLTLDGRPTMPRIGPFLWLDWDRARFLGDGPQGWMAGERSPTRHSSLRHRRNIRRLGDDHWVVVDDAGCPAPERFRLHWLLADLPWRETEGGACLETPAGTYQVATLGPGSREFHCGSLETYGPGEDFRLSGLISSCYLLLEPAVSFTSTSGPARWIRWVTVLGPGPFDASLRDGGVQVTFGPETSFLDLPELPFSGESP